MIESVDIFPTRFFGYKIEDDTLIQNIYSEVYEKRDKIRSISWATEIQGDSYTTDYNSPVKIENFHLAMDLLSKSFAEAGVHFTLTEYWTALYKKGSYHTMHNHTDNILKKDNYSGILYLTNCGQTYFFSQNASSFDSFFTVRSQSGRFVLFPSSMPHQVVANLDSDEERCVIAFNGDLREL